MSTPQRLQQSPTESAEGKVSHGFRWVTPAEKARLVREHFDRVAPTYDVGNTLLSFGLHKCWKRAAVRMMGLREGDRVLDVCGGTADLALLTAHRVGAAGRVVLCDCNPAMIARGALKVARRNALRNIDLVCGDAERIPGPDDAYDAVTVGFGVRNLVRMQDGLREMWRALRPGGQLMCLEFSQPPSAWFRLLYDVYSFRVMPLLSRLIVGTHGAYLHLAESIRLFPTPDAFAAVLGEAGFRDVTYRLFTHGIVAVHRGRKPTG